MKTYNRYFRTNIDFVHHNFIESENLSTTGKLLKVALLGYYAPAVAKSAAEPENSNDLQLANKSTPLNRAIFVCSTRTSKERLETLRGSECLYELGMPKFGHTPILSMVACNGKGFALCYVPIVVVSQPVTRYRPNPEKFSGSLHQTQLELSAMIYLFKAVSRLDLRKTQKPFTSFPHYTLKVQADSVEQAQASISRLFAVLSVAVVKNFAKNPQNPTACDTEQNHSLLNASGYGYDEFTTTKDGSRSRYSSGIFLPQIHQNHGITTPEIYSELAVRATPRTKADSIRTNKGGCSLAVVEPLSHLFSDKPLSLTKTKDIMKKSTQTQTGTTATNSPIVRSPRFEGVAYA